MASPQTKTTNEQGLTKIVVPTEKANFLFELSRMSVGTLSLLAELSKKPGIEEKLKAKASILKYML
jgi:hypothetical protein